MTSGPLDPFASLMVREGARAPQTGDVLRIADPGPEGRIEGDWVPAVTAFVSVRIDPVADANGGAITTVITLQLLDADGSPLAQQEFLKLQLFDTFPTILAAAPELTTASLGSFADGEGSNDAIIQTDVNGAFSCTALNVLDGTLTVACGQTETGTEPINCDITQTFSFNP